MLLENKEKGRLPSNQTIGKTFDWKAKVKKEKKEQDGKPLKLQQEQQKVPFKGFFPESTPKEKNGSEISFGQHDGKSSDIMNLIKNYIEVKAYSHIIYL